MGVGKPSNFKFTIENNTLTITVDLNKELGLSRSKKNILIATTSGSLQIAKGLWLNLNVYKAGQRVTPYFRWKDSKNPRSRPRIKRRTK